MTTHRFVGALALLVVLATSAALGQGLEAALPDAQQEARAQELNKRIRCLVCQNQSIHESNAELARDLRIIVRERIAAGDTNEEAAAFLVARYGDWVLLKPPFSARTVVLWLGPPLILAAAIAGSVFYFARARRSTPELKPLSAEEKARITELLGEERQG